MSKTAKKKKPDPLDLFQAVHDGDMPRAELLIREGVRLGAKNKYGCTPLTEAILKGKAAMVKLLVEAGADLSTTIMDDGTELHAAAHVGNVSLIELLVAHGATVDAPGKTSRRTPLREAVVQGHTEAVRAFLALGANPNAPDQDGWTPLHLAAVGVSDPLREHQSEIVDALLRHGADPKLTISVAAVHYGVTCKVGSSAAELARQQGSEALAARLEQDK